jgi:hypothetical protein
MALSFSKLVRSVLATIFGLGGEWIRPVTYVRPMGFNASTGLTEPVEVTASCQMLLLNYRPMDLSFTAAAPGQEKILIRSGELAGVNEPGAGDYVRQEATLEVWEVMGSRLDVTGEYWLFQALRSADGDWGGLAAHTLADDWGDLTSANQHEDWGALV